MLRHGRRPGLPPDDHDEGSASQRVYGCAYGQSSVELRVRGTNQLVGSASITVRRPPTATPTATPVSGGGGGNPPPPQPQPTGWIEASPSKIVVGQTTTITAGWSNLDQDPRIVPSSTSLAPSCSGATGKSIIGPQQTQVMTGCSAGTIAVTLRVTATNKILATATVKVLPKPVITSAARRAYRWFDISWSVDSDFTTINVEWRNQGDDDDSWSDPLPTSGDSGPRALINSSRTGAAIRGLDYETVNDVAIDVEVRLVVTTANNLKTRSSPYVAIQGVSGPAAAGKRPSARPHDEL